MAGKMETVNISKASSTTNLFYLFFHGGKAAIIPFLTLFFRLLGLNALEAGAIIAAKTVTGLIWAPLWSRCAAAYNRHRIVLVFSLFMMMVTYLSFPALYTQLSKPEHCYPVAVNDSLDSAPSPTTHRPTVTTQVPAATTQIPATVTKNTSHSQSSTPTNQGPDTTTTPSTTPTPTQSNQKSSNPVVNPEANPNQTVSTQAPNLTPTSVSPSTRKRSSTTEVPREMEERNEPYDKAVALFGETGLSFQEILEANLSNHQLFQLLKIQKPGLILTEQEISVLYDMLKERADKASRTNRSRRSSAGDHQNTVVKRSDWRDQIKDKLYSIQDTLQNDKLLLFLVILAIIVGGEIFASPVEKVADDSWFDFLNRIDDLERYGQQRFWGSLAFVMIPIIVTLTVDHTPCFLPFHIHHYLLHFYIFAILTAAALIVACCYPVPPPSTGKYMSKICKSLHLICCDGRGFLFSVTLLLTGMVYAAYHNFLFWRIQDLGGNETPMGLCVSIGAFAEIPMLILSGRLVKKLGHSWMVSLSLFVLSLRVLYYAFIPEPWAFLPIELTHGITHTALWFAILSYDDFNVGAALDRSLRSVLSSFYFGIGFSAGSIVAGYIYHTYDSSILFWGCSAVTGGWFLLFSIIQKCIPQKEKVRYIKLLRSDSDNSDDEEDDWLEMALKNH